MRLKTLASHTIDLGRVGLGPYVLDVGCRDFDFTRAALDLWPAATVLALDPGPDVVAIDDQRCHFYGYALVGDDRIRAGFAHYSTGHGDFLTEADKYYDAKMITVPCVNTATLMQFRVRTDGLAHFDIVKLDCEGSEFEILENWPGPIAGQISVEFHDWDKPQYTPVYYEALFARLKTFGYRVVQHELTDINGRGAIGHWDSLLVLEA